MTPTNIHENKITKEISFKIQINNQTYQIDLRPNLNLLAQNSTINYVNKTNKTVKIQDLNIRSCFYHGKVKLIKNSSVALSICQGLVIFNLKLCRLSLNN